VLSSNLSLFLARAVDVKDFVRLVDTASSLASLLGRGEASRLLGAVSFFARLARRFFWRFFALFAFFFSSLLPLPELVALSSP
jgi:hypothetical protein